MPRLFLYAALAAMLAACTDGSEAPFGLFSAAERDAERCTASGLEPGTEPHDICQQRAAYYREARRDYRSLATPGVRCTAGSNAGGCF